VDSKTTSNAFHSKGNDVIEFDSIITKCKHLFSSKFPISKVEFNRRQANLTIDALGEEAALSVSLTIQYEVPNCIDSVIINEML